MDKRLTLLAVAAYGLAPSSSMAQGENDGQQLKLVVQYPLSGRL